MPVVLNEKLRNKAFSETAYVSNQDYFAIKLVRKQRFLIDEGVYSDGKWMLFYAHPTEFIAELLV